MKIKANNTEFLVRTLAIISNKTDLTINGAIRYDKEKDEGMFFVVLTCKYMVEPVVWYLPEANSWDRAASDVRILLHNVCGAYELILTGSAAPLPKDLTYLAEVIPGMVDRMKAMDIDQFNRALVNEQERCAANN